MNFKNKDGWTCLHLASRNENPAILQSLAKRNINFDVITKNGRTALHIAALHGNFENVKLIAGKINVNCEDYSGNTPFHEAVLGRNIEVIDYLAAKGANVLSKNKTGSNVLHLAAGNGSDNIVEYLVTRYNLDVNDINLNGHTSLHCASRKKHLSTFELLVKLGAKREIKDECGRQAEEYLL